MEQSEFIEYLEEKEIRYEIKDNVISILGDRYGTVFLPALLTLIESTKTIQFNNGGHVNLRLIRSLPENIQFNNGGHVDLIELTSLPESTQFNNGGFVDLYSLKPFPENFQFNNGGHVYSKFEVLRNRKNYIERNNLEVKNNKIILYKRVSVNFLTQECKEWQTRWKIGSTITHPNWDPTKDECGGGKFHACAVPFWCDGFRYNKSDKYIAIEIRVEDLYEWTEKPIYPQKIAFREGKVLYECDRYGTKV